MGRFEVPEAQGTSPGLDGRVPARRRRSVPRHSRGLYLPGSRPSRWSVIAWLTPPCLQLITLAVQTRLPGIDHDLDQPALLVFLQAVLSKGTVMTTLFAHGEELRWRGLKWHELRQLGFRTSGAVIGVTWGMWHWPLILAGYNHPTHGLEGLGKFVVQCWLLGNLLSYLRLRSGSVIAAAVGRGAFNASAVLSERGVHGGSDLVVGPCGIILMATLLVLNLAIAIWDRHPEDVG